MVILASSSPRRKQLLKEIFTKFLIIPSNIDETKYEISSLAYYKGLEIYQNHPNDLIISADTIVVLNNQILGKPKNEIEARNMLNSLSNVSHKVITNYAVFYKDKVIKKSVTSVVTFNNLTSTQINEYIDSKSPFDKAGGYGIQDNEKYHLIKSYEGSLSNIIGLPVEDLKQTIIDIGYKI